MPKPASPRRIEATSRDHAMNAQRNCRPHPHQPHGAVLLPRWQRWLIWSALTVLTASGLLWLGLHWFAPSAQDMPTDAAGQLWCIRVHAAAALLTLIAVGSLLPIHVRSAWRVRKNRPSGAINLIILGLLALTGYALGYASEGGLRQGSAWLHWSLGCAVPLVLLGHVGLGRRGH